MIKHKYAILMIPLLMAAAGCQSSSTSSSETDPLRSYSDEIKDISFVSTVTGSLSKSRTDEMTVGGCDLGFPLYNETNDTMYLGFGDSFTSPLQSGRWRSNTVALSTDEVFSDGLDIDSFISSPSGIAKPFIEGQHIDRYEMTKIPTGGIEIEGTMYWFYFSKYSWNTISPLSMNYGGAVKSTDNGVTWERVYSLTWVDHIADDPNLDQALVADIQRLVNQDADLMDDGGNVDIEHHEGYDFTQIFPKMGPDGYVYLFGEGGYRSQGLKLGRVPVAQFEDFDAIEYLTGYDEDDAPIWVQGRDGLDAIKDNTDSYIIGSAFGEMSVVWNEFLGKWMAMTVTSNRSRHGAMYFVSDEIYGPWSSTGVLLFPPTNEVTPNGAIYAPLTHEKWQEEDGRIFYMVISTWMPAYNPSFLRVELW
jgi:hypothetical protein